MKTYTIKLIVGSTRKESYNRKVANSLIALSPENLQCEILEIGQLEMFNDDLDQETSPESWTEFRQNVKETDAFIFVTPEFNRSIPSALKNAIDIASRPSGKGVWGGKPAAIISASTGSYGAISASHHLRQILISLNMPTMAQPETYIGKVMDLFDENSILIDEQVKKRYTHYMESFKNHIELYLSK